MHNYIEFHLEIMRLLENGWVKQKKGDHYIHLKKDGFIRKISLKTGLTVSIEKEKVILKKPK